MIIAMPETTMAGSGLKRDHAPSLTVSLNE
jgi:hypothetical protein